MLATPSTPAARALRSAGLMGGDKDTVMRDVSGRDRQGGRKGASRTRHRSIRPASLAIKGASSLVPTTPVTRTRRNAVSSTDAPPVSRIPIRTPPSVLTSVGGKVTGAVAHWKEVVESRWDAASRFLNLDNLIEHPLVLKYRLSVPGAGGGTSRDAAAIFKLASQLKPEVQTISLANNALTGPLLVHFSRYLPRILNLSLANNKLKHWKDLEPFFSSAPKAKHKMLRLRELDLTGNPLLTIMSEEKYRSEMARRITSLAMLDQKPLSQQVSFDAPLSSLEPAQISSIKPTSTTFPAEMTPSFIDGIDIPILTAFLTRYFSLPQGCEEIAQAYMPNALFSYQANTTIPIRARIQGLHTSPRLPNQSKLNWSEWHSHGSRNLVKVAAPDKIVKSLHSGPIQISRALASLPRMKIDMSGGKSSLDAFMVPGGPGLMVCVHGEFVEGGSEGVRSFDRTFMLCPPGPTVPPQANPWPLYILSDQLTIRAYSDPAVWQAGPMTVLAPHQRQERKSHHHQQPQPQQTPQPVTIDKIPSEALNGLNPNDVEVLLQFMNRTRLTAVYALDCLRTNAGNLDNAFMNFESVKAGLPMDAFLPGS